MFLLLFGIVLIGAALSGSAAFRTHPVHTSGTILSLENFNFDDLTVNSVDTGNATVTDSKITLSVKKSGSVRVERSVLFAPIGDWKHEIEFVRVSGHFERLSAPRFINKHHQRPKFATTFYANETRKIYTPVFRPKGLISNYRFSRLARIGPGVNQVKLNWELHSTGSWRLNKLDVTLVSTNKYYTVIRNTLAFIGTALFGFLFVLIFKSTSRFRLILVVMPIVVIVGFAAINNLTMKAFTVGVVTKTVSFIFQGWLPSQLFIQKVGHLLIYSGLTLAMLQIRKRINLGSFQLLCLMSILACMTEAIQRHELSRTASITDIIINGLGILLGYLLWRQLHLSRSVSVDL